MLSTDNAVKLFNALTVLPFKTVFLTIALPVR